MLLRIAKKAERKSVFLPFTKAETLQEVRGCKYPAGWSITEMKICRQTKVASVALAPWNPVLSEI
jgi:hypothetical protein